MTAYTLPSLTNHDVHKPQQNSHLTHKFNSYAPRQNERVTTNEEKSQSYLTSYNFQEPKKLL